jgi:hypothetical protein
MRRDGWPPQRGQNHSQQERRRKMKAMQGLRVWVIMLLLGAVGASCPTPSVAGEASPIPKPAGYPSRPVEFIVPFDPGGGADASQRVFDKYAEPLVGQRLVIVNKPGAGGATGWAELVRAKPDGYTLAILTPPFNIIPALVRPKQTGYKLDQFTNICVYAIVPDLLYAREGGQFKTLKDVVEYAKQNPDKIKAANTGTLGADFMTTLLIEHATGTAFTQIPFTGGAQALQATLAGTTDVMVGSSLTPWPRRASSARWPSPPSSVTRRSPMSRRSRSSGTTSFPSDTVPSAGRRGFPARSSPTGARCAGRWSTPRNSGRR